ncbi:MAG: hypothetical protein ACHBN1_31120 [Heteroscytonema crispum UTEX LB 1556]
MGSSKQPTTQRENQSPGSGNPTKGAPTPTNQPLSTNNQQNPKSVN